MIRRLLLLLAAFFAALWWLRRGKRKRAAGSTPSRGAPAGSTDPMVRDRVCNTFLPRSRALVVRSGDEELFFCSEACREKHSAASEGR